MKTEFFISEANNRIPSDPKDRLSKNSKGIFLKDNFIVDIHCHLFDITTINIKYFLIRLLKDKLGLRNNQTILNMYDTEYKYLSLSIDDLYLNKPSFLNDLENDNNWLLLISELKSIEKRMLLSSDERSSSRGVSDILKNRRLLSLKKMEDVYNYYIENFSLNKYHAQYIQGKDIFITALMMDLEIGWNVKTRKTFKHQIHELQILGNERPILPFLCIDPRRMDLEDSDNLYSLFLKAFSAEPTSFFGIKIYPGMGYFPSDYRLIPIYEICERKSIPIITHCGGETITSNEPKIEAYRFTDKVIVEGKNRKDIADQFNDPKEWIPVLDKYKKLKINFGHFGGNLAWYEFQKTGTNARIKTIIELMQQFEYVYADFSFNVIDSGLYRIYRTILDINKIVLNKSLYGSDFWVVCAAGDLHLKQEQFLNIYSDLIEKLSFQNSKRFLFEQSYSDN